MHSTCIALACLLVTAASVAGYESPAIVLIAALVFFVAVIGVPHGGLDHWTGRRLLGDRFPRTWAVVFFPIYLAVSLVVILGWTVLPTATAVGFFLISAWHFGVEDEQREYSGRLLRNLVAIAVGGLIIWVPILAQPLQVRSLLKNLLPSDLATSTDTILATTGAIAIVMMPIAALAIAADFANSHNRRALRDVGFAMMFATADVALSFGIYFCGWHSIRGLQRLAQEHQISITQVLVSAMPLSFGAISMAVIGFWWWSSGQTLTGTMTKTLLVTLSAIAVPHLLLHGPLSQWFMKMNNRQILPQLEVSR